MVNFQKKDNIFETPTVKYKVYEYLRHFITFDAITGLIFQAVNVNEKKIVNLSFKQLNLIYVSY